MQERVELSGYDYTLIGENLAYGYDNADLTLLQLWLSDGHRENILKRGFKDVGVGYCENYWVILYGSNH